MHSPESSPRALADRALGREYPPRYVVLPIEVALLAGRRTSPTCSWRKPTSGWSSGTRSP